MSNIKKNDWIAVNLNAPENLQPDALYGYGITPSNTGLQSEDYYKSKKQVIDTFTDKSGKFNEERFHAFYESAQRSYTKFQQEDFTQKFLDEIESSPYDIFSLGDGRQVMDTTALIFRSRDPQRTTTGLGNLYEVGTPTYDVREVAQANKARDKDGKMLDWSPNDKGGFWDGLFRPTMVLATYDEDVKDDKGRVIHHAGDLKLDTKGDPYYEELGDREIYGKETLHYWDTITRDDSAWNKIDFMDSDGLTKSVGGTVMRTAVSLLPYFIPGVGQYFGYIGAAAALAQTLPIISKGIDGIITGTTDNGFGKTMSSIESFMDRFGHSQSREAMGKFFSFENIGDIVSSSAGQLFQQRMIAQIPKKLMKSKDILRTSKIGQNLSLAYMISTSSVDSYATFKEAGASDAMAGIGLLGVMGGFSILMTRNYFKDALFTNTFMDEDIAMRDTIKQLVKESTVEPFATYNASLPKAKNAFEKRLMNTWLYKKIENNIINKVGGWAKKIGETRPTVKMVNEATEAIKDGSKKIGAQMRASMYLSRALNEGIEETMEEGVTDIAKAVTIGLDALGIDVTKDDKKLDFGLSLRDMLSRYGTSFIGGAIGGAVFEGFNHWEGGEYDSLLEKSLAERLIWYKRNGGDQEVRNRIDKLYKQGKLGNANLSSKGTRIKSIDGKDTIVYGQGDENDNQNKFVYNVINSYLDRLDSALSRNDLFTSDNQIFNSIWKSIQERRGNDTSNPEMQLYHFLDDLDSAKALTLTQMGFLNAVKEDADKLSYEILKLDDEINQVKAKIRRDHGITDSNRSSEDSLFKENQYLKTLEKQLKDKRKIWEQLLNGERNGYYMGYAHMMAHPVYSSLYNNPHALANQTQDFPRTEFANWVLYTTGLKYENITDETLKAKLEKDYQDVVRIMGTASFDEKGKEDENNFKERMRMLYDMHISFGETFANDIIKGAEQIKDRRSVNFAEYLSNFVINYSQTKPRLQQLISEYGNTLFTDENSIQNFFKRAFVYEDGTIDVKGVTDFIKQLNAIIKTDNVDFNSSTVRNYVMSVIIDAKIKAVNSNNGLNKTSLFKRYSEIESDLSDVSGIEAAINEISDEDLENNKYLKESIEEFKNNPNDPSIQEQISRELVDYKIRNWGLVNGNENVPTLLSQNISNLLESIAFNRADILEKYNNLISFISKESGLSEAEAKNWIDSQLFSDGVNLVDFTIEQQAIENENNFDPVADLLQKFDIYLGGNLYNTLRTILDEEAYRDSLEDPSKYTITSASKQDELTRALSFLNIVSAVLLSATDGMNEDINTSRDTNPLAVIDQNLLPVYRNKIKDLFNRINNLLEVSKANRLKTTRAQQETLINMNKIRVKQLTSIGTLKIGNIDIDFEQIWKNTGFVLTSANIETAVEFDEAYKKFEAEISNKMHEAIINALQSNNLQSDNLNNVFKSIADLFGEDVYITDPGEISDDPDIIIPAYALANYLLSLGILNSFTFASIWKTVSMQHPELIPLYSQEYAVREVMASVIDYKENYNIFDAFHQYLYNNFPKQKTVGVKQDGTPIKQDWTSSKYIEQRKTLSRFVNVDGIGGVGKTEGVLFLADQCIKLHYDSVSSSATSLTEEAAKHLQEALRLGDNNVPYKTFDKLLSEICTDSSGKVLFDFNSCWEKTNNTFVLKKNADGKVVDKNGNSISNLNKDAISALFNSKDGLRILYLDESGLLTRPQIEFLEELAKEYNFFIVASGDTLQNKAEIDGDPNGIEDLLYHRLPSLTISMRSENNGVYKNVQLVKNVLAKANKEFFKDPSVTQDTLAKSVNELLSQVQSGNNSLSLIYDENTFAGHQLINRANGLDFAKKMVIFVKKLADSETTGKKHQLAIVADKEEIQNQYRNALSEYGDLVIVTDSRKVQGKEFDYVLVDKDFNKGNSFMTLQDLYTMITRARIGAAIVDEGNILRNLGFENKPDTAASEPVLGSDPETRAAMFKEYSDWRYKLMEKTPEFVKTQPERKQIISTPVQITTPTGSNDEETHVSGTLVYGTDENKPEFKTNEEVVDYYKEKVKERGGYYARALNTRESEISSNNRGLIDFDVFVDALKDISKTDFEDDNLSIVHGYTLNEGAIRAHRAVIAMIARGIVNNNSPEDRKTYFINVKDILAKRLQDTTIDVGNIIVDLQNSFDDGGFFFVKNGYIYYSFKSNKQYAIPIAVHNNPAIDKQLFKNITFNKKVGTIPISSHGEYHQPVIDVLSEIDGIVTDKNDNAYIGVLTYNDLLEQDIKELLKKYDGSPRFQKIYDAIQWIKNNSGKAMLSIGSMASIFETGENVFKILRDSDQAILSGTNKEYDWLNLAQDYAFVGIQKITTLQDWYRAAGILRNLSEHKNISVEDGEFIKRYFNDDSILDRFNSVNENKANVAANYKLLSDYKILNGTAIDGLDSAIFRYLTDNPNIIWRSKYLQNFVKWLSWVGKREDDFYHKRGISVRFTIKDDSGNKTTHVLTVIPTIDNDLKQTGYQVLYSNSNGANWTPVYTSKDGDTLPSLFKNTNFDFISAISKILNFTYTDNNVNNLVAQVKNNIADNLKNGSLLIIPTDLRYNKDENIDLPSKIYFPYESDIYRWLTTGDDGKIEPLSAQDLQNLEEFLKKDSVFKHNLYRNVKATYTDDVSKLNGWLRASDSKLDAYYIDIVKVIQPLYDMDTEAAVDPTSTDGKTMLEQLSGTLDSGKDLESSEPTIITSQAIITNWKNGTIDFNVEWPIVNKAWVKQYTDKEITNQATILDYNIVNNTISLNEDGTITTATLTDEGKISLIGNLDIKSEIDEHTITSIDGNTIIIDNKILIDNVPYTLSGLIGVKDNTYTFAYKDGIVKMRLNDSEVKKLSKHQLNNIKSYGDFIGVYDDDFDQRFAIYINYPQIILKNIDSLDEAPMLIDINNIVISDNSVNIAGTTVTDPNIINELKIVVQNISNPNLSELKKSRVNSELYLVSGNCSLSSEQLKSMIVEEVESNKTYHILAFDNSRLGYYEGDDLLTFKWGTISNFDSTNIEESDVLENFSRLNIDWSNPGKVISDLLDEINYNEKLKFEDLSSNSDSYETLMFKNGSIVNIINTDSIVDGVSTKQRRAIYKYLKTVLDQEPEELSIGRNIADINVNNINSMPIIVSYRVNNKDVSETYIVDDTYRVIPYNPSSIDLNNAEAEFDKYFTELNDEFNQIQEKLNDTSLLPEQIIKLQEQLNIISPILSIFSSVKSILTSTNVDKRSLIRLQQQITDPNIKGMITRYIKAMLDKNKC